MSSGPWFFKSSLIILLSLSIAGNIVLLSVSQHLRLPFLPLYELIRLSSTLLNASVSSAFYNLLCFSNTMNRRKSEEIPSLWCSLVLPA